MAVNIKLSKQQQQYLVLAVMVIGGGGFAYVKYFYMPTSQKIQETRESIKTVEGKIQKAQRKAQMLDKIEKQLAELNEKAAAAEKRLPKKTNLPEVIELMTDLTRRYNTELKSFSTGKRSKKTHFVEVSYQIAVDASFHDLGRLLAAIAMQERIFNVRDVKYSKPKDGKMPVKFLLVSYQYKG
ncbi:type 4a pilus biogenesis protein PilO [Elusimicrobiota bacterium]